MRGAWCPPHPPLEKSTAGKISQWHRGAGALGGARVAGSAAVPRDKRRVIRMMQVNTVAADIQHPDARALFDWARVRMRRHDCRRLAEMEWDVAVIERVVGTIVESGGIPEPLMDPVEACAVWRWGYAEHVTRQDRIVSVFATTMMLLGSHIPDSSGQLDDGQNESLAVMVWSVLGLRDCKVEAAQMLDWMGSHPSSWAPWPRSFVALARLLVGVWLGEPAGMLESHAAVVVRLEEEDSASPEMCLNDERWRGAFVLGLTNFDQTHELWVRMCGTTVTDHEGTLRECPGAREVLMRIAGLDGLMR